MRELTGHKVNPANDRISVIVEDEPGHGGACHKYAIGIPAQDDHSTATAVPIHFQDGPIGEVGVNGITHEALLAILIDRLQSFQKGPYSGRENALALTKLEEAQHWLQHRTKARMDRGVEGTHTI